MEVARRDPRGQGDQGELSAFLWLRSVGAPVFVPLGHSPDIDLMTVLDEKVLRVQVKTSTYFRNGRWQVAVCTRGGNRSWSGVVKYLDPARYDRPFVLAGDGRRWFIPSHEVRATSCLALGGPSYAKWEIEGDAPIRRPVPTLD